MPNPIRDHVEFFRQFRSRFQTTGAVAPSSRYLANAMTKPLSLHKSPKRILEIGPGTGAVTRRIVELVQPDDRFDLVELNEAFADILRRRFTTDPTYQSAAAVSEVHVCALQDFQSDQQYDYIVSGLPLNNFPVELVRDIFATYFRLLAPGGVLSYFEYMYVRPMRKLVAGRDEKQRLAGLNDIMSRYLADHRYQRDWVFVNFPPAWVQHLTVK